MKNFNFKALVPHLVAVAVFLLVAVIFCKPALESGVVMQQGDVASSEAMHHQIDVYYQQHGVYPLWSTTMFSGMPAYQILIQSAWSPFTYLDKVFQLWLPKPLNFFFLSCICFYFFCLCLRIRPYVAILGGLAFAYSTYTPIIAVAGHDTKLLALAYAPALIGSIILLFDKKYFAGFVLTALFATLQLAQNHQQISYYTFIIIAVMAVFYLVRWIKAKEITHLVKVIPMGIGAALIAVASNAVFLFPVMDYAKYSKRGGQLIMDSKAQKNDKVENNKTTGLSRDYAFQWSYGKAESMSLLFPGITGYGSYSSQRDGESASFPQLDDNSNLGTYFSEKLNISGSEAESLSGAVYWGDKPFTVGSNYLGAVVCYLFILGLFFLDNKHKWWLLTASIIGIILAMGKNLPAINNVLFDHLPFYNKFRTPEMALVIPQVLFPAMAALVSEKLIAGNYVDGLKKFRLSIIATAVVFAIAGLFYFSLDYSKENKQRTEAINNMLSSATDNASFGAKMEAINAQYQPSVDNQVYENILSFAKGDPQKAKGAITALRKDRQSFFGADILRSLLFVSLTIGLVALFLYKKTSATFLLVGLPLLVVIDLVQFDMHYLNDKSFDDAEKYHSNEFQETEADRAILQDKDPNYRVFNVAGGDPFQDAKPAYYHKSIGGYHAAKLGIYDDLITYQLSGQPNPAVLNMLNTKYIIQKSADGKSLSAIPNAGALGNCWFVKGVKFVHGPVEEMKALTNLNPSDTAVVDDSYKTIVGNFSAGDSTSSIKQTSFDNDDIKYASSSNAPNLAVFSEIFYKDWNAYIDGTLAPIAKADYVLRAVTIPAGKHTIEFKFEPKIYNLSKTIATIAIWLLAALLIAFGLYSYRKSNEQKA